MVKKSSVMIIIIIITTWYIIQVVEIIFEHTTAVQGKLKRHYFKKIKKEILLRSFKIVKVS